VDFFGVAKIHLKSGFSGMELMGNEGLTYLFEISFGRYRVLIYFGDE
jgi:hypothetical protein